MQKPDWQKSKPYVIQSALFIMMGLVGWFGIGHLRSAIQTAKDHIQELDVLTENREHQMSRLPDLREQHEYIDQHQEALGIILTKEKLVDFIRTLETLAGATDVKLKISSRDNVFLESKITLPTVVKGGNLPGNEEDGANVTSKAPAAKKPTGILGTLPLPKYVRLTITATGEYKSIATFLHQMETLPFALDIIALQIKEQADRDRVNVTESGVNPFNPDGTPNLTPVAPPKPTRVILDADFDTVVYLQS